MKETDYQSKNIRNQSDIINDPDFLEKIKTFAYNPNKEYEQKEFDGDRTMHDKLSGDETSDYKGIVVHNPGGFKNMKYEILTPDIIEKIYKK